jgi:nitrogenase molybdenum-iron protein NifN
MVSPADLRHLKEIATDFDLPIALLPDYSESLDGGTWAEYERLPEGGTTLQSIRSMGQAAATIEFGSTLDPSRTAGRVLQERHGASCHVLDLPVGIRQSDAFFDLLSSYAGKTVPAKHAAERGRLVDGYIDAHKYLSNVRAIVYGDEDLVVGLSAFLTEVGIKPVLCGSGGRSGRLGPAVKRFAPDAVVRSGVDFLELEEAASELSCDLLIGGSKGYPLSRKLGKPLVRVGFPIQDRIGANRVLHLGYRGTHDLLDRITNTLIAAKQDSDPTGYMTM